MVGEQRAPRSSWRWFGHLHDLHHRSGVTVWTDGAERTAGWTRSSRIHPALSSDVQETTCYCTVMTPRMFIARCGVQT